MVKRVLAAALLTAVAANSSAWAAWGCQGKDNANYNWYGWGLKTEAEARDYIVNDVCAPAKHGGCRIVECRPGVDNQAQAEKLWSNGNKKVFCTGNAKC